MASSSVREGILPKPIHTARQLEQFLAEVHTFIEAAQHSALVVDADRIGGPRRPRPSNG